MKLNEQGFTLIEALCVLAIFLIITLITAFSIKPQYESIECKEFLTQLQADLFHGQQFAISHQQEVSVVIMPDEHYYYIRNNFAWPPYIYRSYSNAVSVFPGTLPLSFKFTWSGSVNKSGSFLARCGNKQYRLTFLLGKGRFYVVKE
jgi:competence protein ComGD